MTRSLEGRSRRESVSHSDIGILWLALNGKDQAFPRFIKACDLREMKLLLSPVKVHPNFDAARADSRFKDLLRCMHLE